MDVESSAEWYVNVLGFERVGEYEDPAGERRKVFLQHAGFPFRLGLCEHRAGTGAAFDERQTGLDHLAFRVSSREELDEWEARLRAHEVDCSSITGANTIPGAAVLVFRDPDNIQLELIAVEA